MADLTPAFEQLRALMAPHAHRLVCTVDRDDQLSLDTNHRMKNGKPLWFGGVQIMKRYVSYHLMPVYVNPALLHGLSPDLKKRMQGKSCFNFTSVEPALFEELAQLTEAGLKDYEDKGYVPASPGEGSPVPRRERNSGR